MTPALEVPVKPQLPWTKMAWFGALLVVIYAPVLRALIAQWGSDEDMSHGFAVPLVSAYIIWQRREELAAMTPKTNWLGLLVVIWGGIQLIIGTLGVELFTARTSLIVVIIGMVWLLCGTKILKKVAFPLGLLFLMVPIPAVLYNQITFPLQGIASKFAEVSLDVLRVPVIREGNTLEVPNGHLSVVEACSGIRSLLTLTFLSLVYGYFFENRKWIRAALLLAIIPVAIVANGSRVTITGILYGINTDYAEGFFHEATGLFLFMADFAILLLLHRVLVKFAQYIENRKAVA